MGPEAAQMFKDRYRKIGQLTPLDYAEPKPEGDLDTQMPQDQDEQGFDPQSVDFSEFFPKDKRDAEEDAKIAGEDDGDRSVDPDEDDIDDEDETPEEKYGEVPEEEYPD